MAVQVTVVVPIGNHNPDGGVQNELATWQLSVEVIDQETVLLPETPVHAG